MYILLSFARLTPQNDSPCQGRHAMSDWIDLETQTADFGDARLDKRFGILLQQLADKPSLAIPGACGAKSATDAAYRFFKNDRVEVNSILQPHVDATIERMANYPVVLLIQDTTEVDLTRKKERVGGPLNSEQRRGIYVHPLYAVTPNRLPLGVVWANLFARDAEAFAQSAKEKKKKRAQLPIEQKESYRWLQGYQQATEVARKQPLKQIVCVGDSEADIYDIYAHAVQVEGTKAEFLVRAKHQNRSLEDSSKGLKEKLLETKILKRMTIKVSKREAVRSEKTKQKQPRDARKAEVTVRAITTVLEPPDRSGLPPVEVRAILVREANPPAGEEPIEWLLVTSLPVETLKQVLAVIEYYRVRWEIEIYFRVLKSGCRIERIQLETTERMKKCLALYLIVAWRVMFLLMLGKDQPEMSCDVVLEEEEWKSVYEIVLRKPAPEKPPTLGEMVRMIAQLGGYLGRKSDGPPGPKAMWIGIQRMNDFALAYKAIKTIKTDQKM